MNTTASPADTATSDDNGEFTTPCAPLNQVLSTLFRLGAEQPVGDLEAAFFAPLREVDALIPGESILPNPISAEALADPRKLTTSFEDFDRLLDAAALLGACKPGEGGHDLGMYFLFSLEEVLERMGIAFPDPEPTA